MKVVVTKKATAVLVNYSLANGAIGLFAVRDGDIEDVRCVSSSVFSPGAWLVPSSTPGLAQRGNGYGVGTALSSKAAGSVGTDNIADGVILDKHINASAGIVYSKLIEGNQFHFYGSLSTITFQNSFYLATPGYFYCERIGNITYLSISQIRRDTVSSSVIIILTLPELYRPNKRVFVQGMNSSSNAYGFIIEPSGVIKVNYPTANLDIYISCSFPSA